MIEYKVIEKLSEAKKAMEAFSEVFNELSPINDMVMNLLADGASSDVRGAEIALDSLPGTMDEVKSLPGDQRIEVFEMEEAYAIREPDAGAGLEEHKHLLQVALDSEDTATVKGYLSVGFGVEIIAEHTAYIEPNPEIASMLMTDYKQSMDEDLERSSMLLEQLPIESIHVKQPRMFLDGDSETLPDVKRPRNGF